MVIRDIGLLDTFFLYFSFPSCSDSEYFLVQSLLALIPLALAMLALMLVTKYHSMKTGGLRGRAPIYIETMVVVLFSNLC